MVNLLLETIRPLPEPLRHATAMAWDSKYCYFPVENQKIVYRLTPEKQLSSCETDAIYTTLCYDSKSRCFWGIPSYSRTKIHRLSLSFCLSGILDLAPLCCGSILSVSYDARCDQLDLFTLDRQYRISKRGALIDSFQHPSSISSCCGASIGPYHCTSFCLPGIWISPIRILDESNVPLNMTCLPERIEAKAICPFRDRQNNAGILVFGKKEFQKPFLLRYLFVDSVQRKGGAI